MKADNGKAIGNWLADIENEYLCLPSFQREQVWETRKICKFIKTLVSDENSPVGTFLVLETTPSNPIFRPRTIHDAIYKGNSCNSLLLDGQQRLSALWIVLFDTDKNSKYYIQFDEHFAINDVKPIDKTSNIGKKLRGNPTLEYRHSYFPAQLLNPLKDSKVVKNWLDRLDLRQLGLESYDNIESLITRTREIFAKKQQDPPGKIIPFFALPVNTDRRTAIDVFQAINTNSTILSKYYLGHI